MNPVIISVGIFGSWKNLGTGEWNRYCREEGTFKRVNVEIRLLQFFNMASGLLRAM